MSRLMCFALGLGVGWGASVAYLIPAHRDDVLVLERERARERVERINLEFLVRDLHELVRARDVEIDRLRREWMRSRDVLAVPAVAVGGVPAGELIPAQNLPTR